MKVAKVERIHHENPVPVYDVHDVRPHHNFVVDGGASQLVLHNCAVMDECNFARAGVKDVNKAKAHMKSTYNTAVARVNGTFRMEGEVWGKVFAVSSKNSDSDFMEDYVEEQLSAGAGDHMYVDSKPQWEVLPPSMFSPEKFYIAVGDRYKKGFVVPDNQTFPEALQELRDQGYKIMTPPVDMRSNFLADFGIALRDLAGIAVPGMLSFITQESIDACINKNRKNPFYSDILEIGTKDRLTIQEFFHLNEIESRWKHCPMTIHLDLSLDVCRSGISGVWTVGRKDMLDDEKKIVSMPTFAHAFSIAIQAPRGDKIPYAKITEFLCWLRKQGLNIISISRDQYQSEYMAQLLEAQGFDSPKISLDRTPDGYEAARSVILEERIDMLNVELLQHELIHLQRDSLSGKIEKPVGGSKDVSDSFAGALWNATMLNPGTKVPAKAVASAIASVNGGRGGGYRPLGNKTSTPFGAMINNNRKR